MMVKERLGNQVMYADSAYIEPELSKLFSPWRKSNSFMEWTPKNFQSV